MPIKVKPSVPIQIFRHEDYNYVINSFQSFRHDSNNDIAIVKFANSINVDPMVGRTLTSLTDWPVYMNDKDITCIVTGWGNSTHMQKARVSYIPQKECRSRLSPRANLTEYV